MSLKGHRQNLVLIFVHTCNLTIIVHYNGSDDSRRFDPDPVELIQRVFL
jgi:hypothetical protein